jgi:hypothetical protein
MAVMSSTILLAESEFLSHLAQRMRGDEASVQWNAILFGLAAVLAVFVVLRWWTRRRPRINNPAALFLELCWAHRLDRRSRRLLVQVARARRIAPLGRLFLEPELFDPAPLGELGKRQARRLERLRTRLFGDEFGAAAPAE